MIGIQFTNEKYLSFSAVELVPGQTQTQIQTKRKYTHFTITYTAKFFLLIYLVQYFNNKSIYLHSSLQDKDELAQIDRLNKCKCIDITLQRELIFYGRDPIGEECIYRMINYCTALLEE